MQGQNGFLTAALLIGGWRALRWSPLLGGALLGLVTLKPQFYVLAPVALVAALLGVQPLLVLLYAAILARWLAGLRGDAAELGADAAGDLAGDVDQRGDGEQDQQHRGQYRQEQQEHDGLQGGAQHGPRRRGDDHALALPPGDLVWRWRCLKGGHDASPVWGLESARSDRSFRPTHQ
jgi:hypothetical protein